MQHENFDCVRKEKCVVVAFQPFEKPNPNGEDYLHAARFGYLWNAASVPTSELNKFDVNSYSIWRERVGPASQQFRRLSGEIIRNDKVQLNSESARHLFDIQMIFAHECCPKSSKIQRNIVRRKLQKRKVNGINFCKAGVNIQTNRIQRQHLNSTRFARFQLN